MKQERGREILKKLKERGLLTDDQAIAKISQLIEGELEEEIEELKEIRNEHIENIDFGSINFNL